MGKYDVNKNKPKKSNNLLMWLIPVCCIALAVAVIAIGWLLQGKQPAAPVATDPHAPTVLVPTFPTIPEHSSTPTDSTTPGDTAPSYPTLGKDLVIDYIGSYAGIYMEDGSDDVVSNMLMIIVENTGTQDLQLARIDLQYAEFVANFQITNLPVGEKVVLLELNRHEYVNEMPTSGRVYDLVSFPEPMTLLEDKVSLSGGNGYIEVTNISGQDLTGEIYICYKNSASDLLYGGITYRVRITNDIPAGQSIRVMTNHYHPDRCSILMVNYVA